MEKSERLPTSRERSSTSQRTGKRKVKERRTSGEKYFEPKDFEKSEEPTSEIRFTKATMLEVWLEKNDLPPFRDWSKTSQERAEHPDRIRTGRHPDRISSRGHGQN